MIDKNFTEQELLKLVEENANNTIRQGECPVCGHDLAGCYEGLRLYQMRVGHDFRCKNCNSYGVQTCELEFIAYESVGNDLCEVPDIYLNY